MLEKVQPCSWVKGQKQGAAHMAVVCAEQAVAFARSLQQRQAGSPPLLSLCATGSGPLCTCELCMLDVNSGLENGVYSVTA